MKYRVEIITVPADNQKSITQVQQKINQWLTTGLLKKYKVIPCGNSLVFNICLIKQEG